MDKKIKKTKINNRAPFPLEIYLKEISKAPLLSKEEEKELGHKIKKGDHKALEKLITSNLRFVVSYAKKFQGLNVSLEDLINEGNIGLIEAAKRFDPNMDVRFISYAVWWIRQSIMNAIASTSGIVKLPIKHITLLHKIRDTIHKLKKINEKEPTINEIAEYLKIPADDISTIIRAANNYVSLDTPISDGEIKTYLELMKEKHQLPIHEQLINKMYKESIESFIDKLDERERIIIIKRFGLRGEEPHTLDKIGKFLNLSKERVRQIENIAQNKLLRMFKTHRLGDSLN